MGIMTPLGAHAIREPLGVSAGAALSSWWLAGGVDPYAAYRAIATAGSPYPGGPANYAASLVELSGGGAADLFVALPPGWAAATGWNTEAWFDEQAYLNGGAFTMMWRGVGAVGLGYIVGGVLGWDGLLFHLWNDPPPVIYGGANTTNPIGNRFHIGMPAGDFVLTYVKHADDSQSLYVNGVEDPTSPKAGTAYTVNTFGFNTSIGGSCGAFWLARAALTGPQVALQSAAIAAL